MNPEVDQEGIGSIRGKLGRDYLKHCQAGSDADIGNSRLLAGDKILISEESLKESECFLEFLLFLSIVFLSVKDLGVKILSDGLVEGADVEVQIPEWKFLKIMTITRKDGTVFDALDPYL